MRVFNGFEHTAYIPRPVVTIGSYDGVHRGHREILSHLEALARARKGESVVVTFHPHPRLVLGRGEGLRLLTTLPEKLELLEQAGKRRDGKTVLYDGRTGEAFDNPVTVVSAGW